MRDACCGIILILIIVGATLLSGCTAGPAPPLAATGTPVASTPAPEPIVKRSGSLFDTGRLQWLEYRLTTTGSDMPAVSDVRFDYTTADIGGMKVRDDRITMKLSDPGMTVIMDRYYDLDSHVQVGSRVKTVSAGASLSDTGLEAGDLYRMGNIADAFIDGDWPVKGLGTEVVTLDGASYTCTKYAIGDAGEHGTAWASDGVPVPVKMETRSGGGEVTTWELTGQG